MKDGGKKKRNAGLPLALFSRNMHFAWRETARRCSGHISTNQFFLCSAYHSFFFLHQLSCRKNEDMEVSLTPDCTQGNCKWFIQLLCNFMCLIWDFNNSYNTNFYSQTLWEWIIYISCCCENLHESKQFRIGKMMWSNVHVGCFDAHLSSVNEWKCKIHTAQLFNCYLWHPQTFGKVHFHLKLQFCEQVLFLPIILKEHSHPKVTVITYLLHIL